MIYVFGKGNGGKLWHEYAEDCGIQVAGYTDDFEGPKVEDWDAIIPAVFTPLIRQRLSDTHRLQSVVHPKAFVARSAILSSGVLIKPTAMVGARVRVGRAAIIDSGVCIEHDSEIGVAAYISVGSKIGSSVKIGDRAIIGIGCTIQTGVTIGEDAVINSGCVVLTDVPAGKTVKTRV